MRACMQVPGFTPDIDEFQTHSLNLRTLLRSGMRALEISMQYMQSLPGTNQPGWAIVEGRDTAASGGGDMAPLSVARNALGGILTLEEVFAVSSNIQ